MKVDRLGRFLSDGSHLIVVLLSMLCAYACYVFGGPDKGMVFGGIALSVLLVPPIVLSRETLWPFLIAALEIYASISAVWVGVLLFASDATAGLRPTLECAVVLACVIAALTGLSLTTRLLRIPAVYGGAMITLLALLWITWPVWLSPVLAGHDRIVAALTVAHPLLAADHVLAASSSPWAEHRLMYNQLSILGQDVPYALPGTILWTCVLHLLVGMSGLLPAITHHRKRFKAVPDLPVISEG